jgi:uncharacterized protein (UPF0332 family)
VATARQHLTDARAILGLGIAHVASREAYLAAYHCVEAFIYERTGKAVKTHSGLRSAFARLVRDDSHVDREFLRFMATAYDLKSIADYGDDPATKISTDEADSAIEMADRLIACLTALMD